MRVMMLNARMPNPAGPARGEAKMGVAVGPLYVATSLFNSGYEVKYMDMQGADITTGDAIMEVEKYQPDVVGISANWLTVWHAISFSKAIKEKYPEIVVIIGGMYPSIKPELFLPNADYVVIGEGEITMPELLNSGFDKKTPGIAYSNNRSTIKTSPRDKINDLDSLGHLNWDLVDKKVWDNIDEGVLITSRGCPFNCIFCTSPLFFGNKFRVHSPEWIADEYELLSHRNISSIFMGDDSFSVIKKRTMKICELLCKREMDIPFRINTRVDLFDNEVADALATAGCTFVDFGIESAENHVLQLIRKHATVEAAARAVKSANKAGIKPSGSFIFGLPGQTKLNTIKATVAFIKETNIYGVDMHLFMLMPGSPAYNSPGRYGIERISRGSLPDYFITPFRTKTASATEIINLFNLAVHEVDKLSATTGIPEEVHAMGWNSEWGDEYAVPT